jgi:hypothetical protein
MTDALAGRVWHCLAAAVSTGSALIWWVERRPRRCTRGDWVSIYSLESAPILQLDGSEAPHRGMPRLTPHHGPPSGRNHRRRPELDGADAAPTCLPRAGRPRRSLKRVASLSERMHATLGTA